MIDCQAMTFLSETEAQARYEKMVSDSAASPGPLPTFVQWLQANRIAFTHLPDSQKPTWMKG